MDALIGSKYLLQAMEEKAKREILEDRVKRAEDMAQKFVKSEISARTAEDKLEETELKYQRLAR